MYTIVLTSPSGRRRTYPCNVVGNRATISIAQGRVEAGTHKTELILTDSGQSTVLSTGSMRIDSGTQFPLNVTMLIPVSVFRAQGGLTPDIVLT